MEKGAVARRNRGMRRRQGLWIGLLAGMLVLGGCASGSGGTEGPKLASYVLSEDVKADLRNMKSPLLDGELLPLGEELQSDAILLIQNDTMLFNKKEGFYAVNIEKGSNQKPVRLLDQPVIEVSRDGKKALYGIGVSPYVLDIDSGKSKPVQTEIAATDKENDSTMGYNQIQFADAEGRYLAIFREDNTITISDTATDKVHQIVPKEYLQTSNYGYSHDVKVFHNELFIQLSTKSGTHGNLYKINLDNGQFSPVISSDGLYIGGFQPLSDGTILFNGQYQNEEGVFLYHPASGKCTTLLSEADVEEGKLTYAFSLSPDQSRILIHDVVNEDIAIAELKDGQLVNKRFVMRGYSLYSLIWVMASWNPDGKSFYIKLGYEEGSSSIDAVKNIVKFRSV